MPSTIDPVGHYCGRFDPSWTGEILNSASNLAFVIAATVGFMRWRRSASRDPWCVILIVGAFSIGVGSFIFHSHPTPRTLPIDLIPIQVFTLAYVAFAMRRWLTASWPVTIGSVLAFGLANRAWARLVRGILGGAAGHGLALVAIAASGVWFATRPPTQRIGRHLLLAAGSYTVALVVRALDLPICATLPIGVHWIWHLLQGVTVGRLLVAACEPAPVGRSL